MPLYLLPSYLIILVLTVMFFQNRLLVVLMLFELGVLILSFITLFFLKINLSFMLMITLSMGAMEAALGLSFLVQMARNFGSDIIKNISI